MNKRVIFVSFCMALIMSCAISFTMATVNIGFDDNDFLFKWLKSWAIGFAVALPLVFIVSRFIQKLADKLGL